VDPKKLQRVESCIKGKRTTAWNPKNKENGKTRKKNLQRGIDVPKGEEGRKSVHGRRGGVPMASRVSRSQNLNVSNLVLNKDQHHRLIDGRATCGTTKVARGKEDTQGSSRLDLGLVSSQVTQEILPLPLLVFFWNGRSSSLVLHSRQIAGPSA